MPLYLILIPQNFVAFNGRPNHILAVNIGLAKKRIYKSAAFTRIRLIDTTTTKVYPKANH